jgi:hypothetical protein
MMSLLSFADDGAVESCWEWCYRDNIARGVMSFVELCWRWHYRGDIGRGAMSLPMTMLT